MRAIFVCGVAAFCSASICAAAEPAVRASTPHDVPTTFHLKPYFAAGAGTADFRNRFGVAKANDWTPVFQLRGGLAYDLTRALSGILEYRFERGEAPKFMIAGTSTKVEFKRHGVVIGLSYHLQ